MPGFTGTDPSLLLWKVLVSSENLGLVLLRGTIGSSREDQSLCVLRTLSSNLQLTSCSPSVRTEDRNTRAHVRAQLTTGPCGAYRSG